MALCIAATARCTWWPTSARLRSGPSPQPCWPVPLQTLQPASPFKPGPSFRGLPPYHPGEPSGTKGLRVQATSGPREGPAAWPGQVTRPFCAESGSVGGGETACPPGGSRHHEAVCTASRARHLPPHLPALPAGPSVSAGAKGGARSPWSACPGACGFSETASPCQAFVGHEFISGLTEKLRVGRGRAGPRVGAASRARLGHTCLLTRGWPRTRQGLLSQCSSHPERGGSLSFWELSAHL